MNQTVRSQCYGSPFVRVSSVENFQENCFHFAPGWILAMMDFPVVSSIPYIWKKGSRCTEIAEFYLHNDRVINATPHTAACYVCVLQ